MKLKLDVKSLIFRGVIPAIVYFVLLLIALVALGSFAAKNTEIQNNLARRYAGSSKPCGLYATGINPPKSGPERNCQFVITGQAIVLVVGVFLLVWSVILAVLRVKL